MPDMTVEQAREMGVRLLAAGRLNEAASVLSQVLAQVPDDHASEHLLGVVALQSGRADRSVELIGRAIAMAPGVAVYHYNLAESHRHLGRLADAESCLRRAIALQGDFSQAHENLGTVLMMRGRREEAAACFREAIRINPGGASAYANLAHAARAGGLLEEAIAHCAKALGLAPGVPEIHNQLGSLLREAGRVPEAIDAFRRAVDLRAEFPSAQSNLLFALHFDPNCSPERLLVEHRSWAARHADPLTPTELRHSNDPTPGRRLRIGYVSPDFRGHMVSLLLKPILERHDRSAFEIVCYSGVPPGNADDMTARIRQLADVWRDTSGMSEEALVRRIMEDRIDILIDLALHMRQNRLGAFARKPAPVQATFIAYPSTSGMRAMDWAITDVHIDPPGETEAFHTERLARLPDTLWCYAVPEPDVAVNDLPAARSGYVTFAALNSFAKVNRPTLELWGRVLAEVPGSRLMVLIAGGDAGNPTLRQRLAPFGIPPERLRLVPTASRDQYLRYYHEVDISLDPMHYTGHTTSLDSLYTGVPLVTLPGRHAVSRAGVSYLRNLGLTELIAASTDDYVRIAKDLAGDLGRLSGLRAGLRERMRKSPLMDAGTYTRHLETLYRQMWTHWCGRTQQPAS
jgi:predicted O-linked N-acetylglucosamine transferase (SPINDLY family)